MSMERTEVLDMMGALKLYGMKGAYAKTLATAIKRKHEPQRRCSIGSIPLPSSFRASAAFSRACFRLTRSACPQRHRASLAVPHVAQELGALLRRRYLEPQPVTIAIPAGLALVRTSDAVSFAIIASV
jgi:hypothetical protein